MAGHDFQSDRVGLGIEEDARLPAFELRAHLRDLLLQGVLALPVVGALAQDERLYDPAQRLRGERLVGDDDGLRRRPLDGLSAIALEGVRQGPSLPGCA